MTSSERLLSDCVEIKRQFLRSVNLEKDFQAPNQNGQYIITPTSRQILRRIAEGLGGESTYRAWTITGPYGVGKSAFAVFLTKVLCHQIAGSESAQRHLQGSDPELAREIAHRVGKGKGMLPVAITARRAPAALCLTEGIRAGLSLIKSSRAKQLATECDSLLRDVRKGVVTDTRRIVSLIASLEAVAHGSGYSGLLFMIDELGKIFEFAARTPQKSDVFVLQEIAEHSSRSGAFPSLFLGFLHQSFEEYGQHLDSLTRKEWAKIHGRFEDVAFLEPADQLIRMIAAAMNWTGELSAEVSRQIRQVAGASIESGACPPGMRKSEFEEICLRTYPLHPLTLVALPFIFRRFAQNERSLFSYLSSMEPNGFQDFLRTHHVSKDSPTFIRLGHLFDYFTVNFGSGLFRQPQARRWLEAADVLDRKDNLQPMHCELVKVIGVLGALGDFSHLSASETMIAAAMSNSAKMSSDLEGGLRFLQAQSILTHRHYNETYRIWEGSDVDIEERVAEGERQLRGRIGLASSIQQYLEPRPLVARRHSFQTGSLRHFSVSYVDAPAKASENLSCAPHAAGQVLVCLSLSNSDLQTFRDIAESVGRERQDVVFAIPQQIGEMLSIVTELAALRWAWENTPELRGDRVARREVALRIAEAEHFLRHALVALLDPRKEPLGSECLWFWNGNPEKVHSRADVSHMLSRICDDVYSQTPRILNELIARRDLSSAAAKARRILVEKMLASSDLPALGIESYPPERSMYESVLRATGLHREVSSGKWGFSDPPEREKRQGLGPVWDQLREIIFGSDGTPRPLDTVFRMLADPPFGVMDGLHPVLLCAFMMAHSDETTLYREGTFIPEPTIADFEVLMRRPELFAIGGSRIAGARAAVVDRLSNGLKTRPATVPIVRSLFRMVRGLPEFAWRTKRLSAITLAMREAFEKAKSPEKFLYVDLPVSLGLSPFPESKPEKAAIEAFFNGLNAALKEWSGITSSTYSEAKLRLLSACGMDTTEAGWQRLREIAAKLESRESDPVLSQFLKRVAQSNSDEQGISSVLALVVNRPPANWTDADVDRFPELAKALGDPIKRSMARAGLGSLSTIGLDALTPKQREQAKSMAQEIEVKLRRIQHDNAPAVMRAALLLLAEKIDKGSENPDAKS